VPFSVSGNNAPSAPAPGENEVNEAAWQVRAIDRSLGAARARSVERMARFVQAARELTAETASSTFTVQQVVERSGQSLKSFYRLFAGKDELLLALIEEDCAVGAVFLAELIDRHDEPARRARAWIEGIFELMAAGERSYVTVLVREHRRLAEGHADEVDAAVHPLLAVLEADIEAGMATGEVRVGDARRDARTIFEVVVATIHRLVLEGSGESPADAATYVWEFCWSGVHVTNTPDKGRPEEGQP
jgi:AcrR family transcriptional regulator